MRHDRQRRIVAGRRGHDDGVRSARNPDIALGLAENRGRVQCTRPPAAAVTDTPVFDLDQEQLLQQGQGFQTGQKSACSVNVIGLILRAQRRRTVELGIDGATRPVYFGKFVERGPDMSFRRVEIAAHTNVDR